MPVLIALYKCLDLVVPLFGARMINALNANQSTVAIWLMAVTAFCVWVVHGSLLSYVIDRVETKHFSIPARQDLSLYALQQVLGVGADRCHRDPALMQVILERGEAVCVDWIVSVIRVVLPLALPFLFAIAMLLWSIPLLGGIVLAGAIADGLITWRLNNALAPAFQTIRDLQNRQGQTHFQIFAGLVQVLLNLEAKYARIIEYTARYDALTTARTGTWMRFLGFNICRGLSINVTHLLTWLVGIWAVNTGEFQVGYLLVFLRWETLVFDFLSHYLVVHKQWMETSPAIVAFFAELDDAAQPASVLPAAEIPAVELPVLPSPLEAR